MNLESLATAKTGRRKGVFPPLDSNPTVPLSLEPLSLDPPAERWRGEGVLLEILSL